MALPRRSSYGGGGGLDIGGLLAALYNMGVFGETEESKRAKELEELQQRGPANLQKSAQDFTREQTGQKQRGVYNAFQSTLKPQEFNPGFPSIPSSPGFNISSVLSPEEQGEALMHLLGSQRIAGGGLLSGVPEANLSASQAGLSNQILSATAPQAAATGEAEANKRLGEATLNNQIINDPELRKNKLLSSRFGALNESAMRIPEGSALLSAGGTTQYTSPTEGLIPNLIGRDKAGNPFYGEPTKIRKPGELIVGKIPLPGSVNPYGATAETPPETIPAAKPVEKTYTIPKKSTTQQSILGLPASSATPDFMVPNKVQAFRSFIEPYLNTDLGGKYDYLSIASAPEEDLVKLPPRVREVIKKHYQTLDTYQPFKGESLSSEQLRRLVR